MAATLDFEVRMGSRRRSSREEDDAPMRILVLGDFRGRGSRPPLERREVLAVDVDNFDGVLSRLGPRVDMPAPGGGAPLSIEFRKLEDFHPDSLCRRLEPFRRLESLEKRLGSNEGFREACDELRMLVQSLPEPGREKAPPTDSGGSSEDDGATLERLLGQAPRSPAGPAPHDPAALLVQRLIAGHAGTSAPESRTEDRRIYRTALDDLASSWLRAILHDPGFQALEGAWRSLHALVSNVETGEELTLHVLDVTREELAGDLAEAGGDLRRSTCWSLLGGNELDVPGGRGWSVLAGNYSFGPEAGDAAFLGALGALASRAGGPFLAAAEPALLGCASARDLGDTTGWVPLPEVWQELRRSTAAPWLGLALPRVLLRLPYGPKRDAVESFAFDELSGNAEQGPFLWGNPAFACARLLADAFSARGWSMTPGDVQDVGELPAFTFEAEGERRLLPCGEAWLGERAGQGLLAQGLMPLLSRRDRNAVRLLRFQSLADPPRALAGPWGE